MIDKMQALTITQREAVQEAIRLARQESGLYDIEAKDGSGEAYAYRLNATEIAWGFTGYRNTARGTVPL
jgi:hypothetical protein